MHSKPSEVGRTRDPSEGPCEVPGCHRDAIVEVQRRQIGADLGLESLGSAVRLCGDHQMEQSRAAETQEPETA